MVAYWRLKHAFRDLPEPERGLRLKGAIEGLARLRASLLDKIPERKVGKTLLLGTWNIRNFDDNRFGHGPRHPESFFYLAEIISAFDILAVQEICADLAPFERLMDTLGPAYDFIMTDVTLGPGGNRERLAFVFDRNKVRFSGIAGELVLPFDDQISDGTKQRQFARTPFSCTFQAGWFRFNFATVHIYFGDDAPNSPQYERRVKEIDAVARFIAKQAKADTERAHILVGDFNIEGYKDKTFDALEKHGFEVFRNKIGSNTDETKFYDQISFMPDRKRVMLANPASEKAHGVFNPFISVFRPEDLALFDPELIRLTERRKAEAQAEIAALTEKLQKPDLSASARKRAEGQRKTAEKALALQEARLADVALREDYYLEEWRTFQISDHFPLFVELDIDFADEYLAGLAGAD
jgi:exonuclease III